MRKVLIASIGMLALVLALGLIPAIPGAQAADICVSKETAPGSPHEYHIGDTIDYVIMVQNPSDTHPMTVDVWDELPPYDDNPNPADMIMLDNDATFAPGETRTYNVSYTVKAGDMEQLEVDGTVYNVVVNTLRVHGEQHYDLVDAEVTKSSIIIQPNTVTTIEADKNVVHAGESANLTVTEENTGDVPLTGAHVELFSDNTSIDILDYSTATASGGNTDDVLDPGETWTWEVVTPAITVDTTFVAIGHGLDSTGLDITPENCFKSEWDEVTITVISPGTEVSITSARSEVHEDESFILTVTETNTGQGDLTSPYVELSANGAGVVILDHSTATPGGGDSDNVLDPGETWTWTVTRSINATTTFVATGHGIDPLGLDITYDNGFLDERDEVTVQVIRPGTTVNITSDKEMVYAGDNVTLTISEKNSGDVSLTGAHVELFSDNTSIDILDYATAVPSGGNSDNVLDPGETWTWTVTQNIADDTTFVAIGHGIDATGLDITYDNGFLDERDEVTVQVIRIHPNTSVNIICVDDKVLLTISETNTGDVSLTGAYVEVFANDVSVAMLDASSATPSGGNSDNVLDPGETWTWVFTKCISETTTFVAVGHGMDPTSRDITYDNGFLDERDQVTIRLICVSPGTLVTVATDNDEVTAGESVNLIISEENTGCVSLTGAHVELFSDNTSIAILDYATAVPSGGNSDNVLDPGETWTWTVTRSIDATTTFVAIGHGMDPGGLDITYPDFPEERDEVTVNVVSLHPNTMVMMDADKYVVSAGDNVTLTISEENTGDVSLTKAYVELFSDDTSIILDYATAVPSGGNSDNVLDPGETWTWMVTRTITADTDFVAIGHGTAPSGLDITYPGFDEERDVVTITIISPGTEVNITASCDQICQNGSSVLTITEMNTGEDALTDAHVELFANGVSTDNLTFSSATSSGNSDNILDPGETWTWMVTRSISATTTFVAIGHGMDPAGLDITYPAFTDERDEITVEIVPCGEATRTQGFWKTHYDYTSHVFTYHLDNPIDLGWVELNSADDVTGMLWANVARTSTGAKRDQLCQARVIASHQAVAAILNSSLENGAPLPVSLSEIASILGGTDMAAIKALGEQLDYYNNSGDDMDIVDADGYTQMSATPQLGKSIDVSIADCSPVVDGAIATSAGVDSANEAKGETGRADLSPAFYGLAALAAGLVILVPIRMLRSRRRSDR